MKFADDTVICSESRKRVEENLREVEVEKEMVFVQEIYMCL